jgi:DNA-binding HxlR family transcriptional regulator
VARKRLVGVETAKKLILKHVSEHGSGRWSDFEKLGIPEATLHRALKELISEGVLAREKRGVYVLRVSRCRTAVQVDCGPRLCELIGCANVDALVQDLIENVGDGITYVSNAYKQFMDFANSEEFKSKLSGVSLEFLIRSSVYEVLADELVKFLVREFLGFLRDKGLYTLAMIELSKFARGIADLEKCEEASQGLPENAKWKFRFLVKTTKDMLSTFYGLNDTVVDTLEKLKEVLKRHGYTGVIKYKPTLSDENVVEAELDMEYVAEGAIMVMKYYYDIRGDLMQFIYRLSLKTREHGCGPLSIKEREELLNIISELSY